MNESAAGVVLAGGASRRFEGRHKALAKLAGDAVISHVIRRIRPQVGRLFLSVERPVPELERFGLAQVPDPMPAHSGPLVGLLGAIQYLAESGTEEWLVLVPCDAPFIPPDLASKLIRTATDEGTSCVIASDGSQWQPTFSAWRQELLAPLQKAVDNGMRGLKQFLDGVDKSIVTWHCDANETANPFFNINSTLDLAEADRILTMRPGNTHQ